MKSRTPVTIIIAVCDNSALIAKYINVHGIQRRAIITEYTESYYEECH